MPAARGRWPTPAAASTSGRAARRWDPAIWSPATAQPASPSPTPIPSSSRATSSARKRAARAQLVNSGAAIDVTASAQGKIASLTIGDVSGGNTILTATTVGVQVATNAYGVSIRGNSIASTSGLGIDLGANGVTANTGSFTATLADRGMNAPVISSAVQTGTALALTGYVGTSGSRTAFAGALVDVMSATSAARTEQARPTSVR
jgi:hypothetical protein